MTATIINFPTMLDRDVIEFERAGENTFTRACDEGCDLWRAATAGGDVIALAPRIHAFVATVGHLASYRREGLDSEILLGGDSSLPLATIPALLLAILDSAAAAGSKPCLDIGLGFECGS